MAIAYLYEFPGMTQDHYDRFVEERYGGQPMPGVISHAAGPSDSGWWAFDVYESQEAADAIGPPAIATLREMGVQEDPSIKTFRVHSH
jgi:hypothetical protein